MNVREHEGACVVGISCCVAGEGGRRWRSRQQSVCGAGEGRTARGDWRSLICSSARTDSVLNRKTGLSERRGYVASKKRVHVVGDGLVFLDVARTVGKEDVLWF